MNISSPLGAPLRIQSLDGLRAFSIVLVLFGHTAGTRNAYPLFPFMADFALLGVRLFYIISGFLITFLLMREHERTGTLSLKHFYTRGALRILPVFTSYLAALALLSWIGILHVGKTDFLAAVTFTVNVAHVTDWNIRHLWSLSTEEQFYLLWPILLVVKGIQTSIKTAVVLMLVSPLASGVLWKFDHSSLAMLCISMNGLAGGCVLGGLRPRLHCSDRYMSFLESRWPLALGLLALSFTSWHGHGAILLYGVQTLFGIVCIDHLITFKDRISQFLNLKPVVYLGTLSYSLYIWQQIFLNRFEHAAINIFPFNLALAFVCSLISLFLIEQPFLRLKQLSSHVSLTRRNSASLSP